MTRTRRLTPVEALERDIVAVFDRPVISGSFRVDVQAAEELVERLRTNGSPHVTVTHLLIKAVAVAAMATPKAHRMFGLFRVLEPDRADVGVSVAGAGSLAPVVVIREADRKPLQELVAELRSKALQAKRDERRTLAQIERHLWLMPIAAVRRLALRLWLMNVNWRRQAFGTVQFSSVDHFNIDVVYTPVVVDMLIMAGAIRDEPFADDQGRVVVRRAADFQLLGSHRKLNGATAAPFIARFREVLSAPECLL